VGIQTLRYSRQIRLGGHDTLLGVLDFVSVNPDFCLSLNGHSEVELEAYVPDAAVVNDALV